MEKSTIIYCGIYQNTEDGHKIITKAGEEKKAHKRIIDELFRKFTAEAKTRAFKSGANLYVYSVENGHVFICVADAGHDTRLCTDLLKEVKAGFDPHRPTALSSRDLAALIVCINVHQYETPICRTFFH